MNLHPNQEQALDLLPVATGVVLLTRHSIREQADNAMPGFDIPLTAEGFTLAVRWGGALNRPIHHVYSSHSPRCVHTGEAMLQGAGSPGKVEIHEKLCEPGCYVANMRVAGPTFVALGPVNFVSSVLRNEVDGMFTMRDATGRFLQMLKATQPVGPEITICVTHDTILSTLVYDLEQRQQLDDDDWPWMLEGVFLWFDQHDVHWVWRGVHDQRELADFGL
jgi:broad specificity phosphatase PhoE